VAIEVTGLREAIAGLQRFEARGNDLTAAWRALVPYLDDVTKQRFSLGHQAMWPPLKHPHPGRPMLVGSEKLGSHLRDSLIYKASPKKLTQATRGVKYAWYHQVGSRGKKYTTFEGANALIAAGGKLRTYGRKSSSEVILADGSVVRVSKTSWLSNPEEAKKGRFVAKRKQAGRGGLAARPFLYLEEADLGEIQQVLAEYMSDAFVPAAGGKP